MTYEPLINDPRCTSINIKSITSFDLSYYNTLTKIWYFSKFNIHFATYKTILVSWFVKWYWSLLSITNGKFLGNSHNALSHLCSQTSQWLLCWILYSPYGLFSLVTTHWSMQVEFRLIGLEKPFLWSIDCFYPSHQVNQGSLPVAARSLSKMSGHTAKGNK